MIELILTSWLVTQQWSWGRLLEPEVDRYRVYWSALATAWCVENRVEVEAVTHCGTVGGCGDEDRCCADIPEPQFSPAFFVVTAVTDVGIEGTTEHGPIISCP